MQKALAQQERATIRMRQRDTTSGPPDDLDLVQESRLEKARAAAAAAAAASQGGRAGTTSGCITVVHDLP